MPGFLVINARSGSGGPDAHELRAAAERAGVEAHVLGPDDDPAELARAATGVDAVGVAGGDGSLGAVAEVALERDLPFVCVPFGTRNHFARDIGLDRDDPFAALPAFSEGSECRIDVGAIGDRIFVNNVSLGLYARLVHRRERHRRRREALARLRAFLIVARARGSLGIVVDGAPVEARVLVVANNAYRLDPLSLGERDRLDEGVLYIYVAPGLWRGSWEERSATSVTIDAGANTLAAAVDGEPAELQTPIEFAIRPQALRLLVPPGLDDVGDMEGEAVARG